jgi:hypothetical protein
MPADKRVLVAEAFWRDDDSADAKVHQSEAVALLARRLKFRPKSVLAMPVERRARQLAQVGDAPDAIVIDALIAYHFRSQRPLMATFLDALGIAHDDGQITAEIVPRPDPDRLGAGISAVRSSFPADDVDLYLRTLVALDGDTWSGLETALRA